MGQIILEQENPVGNIIELKELNRGIHYLQFQSSNQIISKQFIKVSTKQDERIANMKFSSVYPCYVTKVEKRSNKRKS